MGRPLISENDLDASEAGYRTDGVVNLANGTIMSAHTLLILTSKILTTRPEHINKHIPPVNSIRGKSTFNVLITINCRPSCTISKLAKYVWSDQRIIKKCVIRLLELDMIQRVKRPRKMPIGPYVMDDTYRTTGKGRNALRKIISM